MEKLKDYFKIKKFEIDESSRLIKTDSSKHFKKVLGLWAMPLMIRGGGLVKESYFFMRHIDDVLDGDLVIKEDPLQYVEKIRSDLVNGVENRYCLVESLAYKSIRGLEKRRKEGDSPKKDFITGIDSMVRDYLRMSNKEVLEERDLKEYATNSFSPYNNIFLTSIGSNLRANDVKIFSYCQYFAYGVQDFDIDWQRGLVNIPREVLNSARLTIENSSAEVRSNLIVKDWVVSEVKQNRVDLKDFLGEIAETPNEKSANFLLNSLSKRVFNILDCPIF